MHRQRARARRGPAGPGPRVVIQAGVPRRPGVHSRLPLPTAGHQRPPWARWGSTLDLGFQEGLITCVLPVMEAPRGRPPPGPLRQVSSARLSPRAHSVGSRQSHASLRASSCLSSPPAPCEASSLRFVVPVTQVTIKNQRIPRIENREERVLPKPSSGEGPVLRLGDASSMWIRHVNLSPPPVFLTH